ncbi:CHAT domain-containing protein [Undibacterium luofuense]|uniref:CHAT domain-containing protein n=1 Tax=Undibacterium luofuense TaxID=2828733 RepID=A0A941DQQ9_9BURK|nr:CHAT domain-containing protein [Undibacterium luofuense]MBR7782341.1 CHAT domain-containing protein [Undibacterium luofuense]
MSEQVSTADLDLQGFNPYTLFGDGFELGSVDLIQGGSFREVIGRGVVALLLNAKNRDGEQAFGRAVIVLPPKIVTKHTKESVFDALAHAIKDLRGVELDEQEKPILRRRVQVVNSPSLEVTDLFCTVKEQVGRCLIVIADASQYRNTSLVLAAAFGTSAVRMSEDRWVPHVASICQQLVPIVKELEGYGLIHVQEIPAQKSSNVELLISIDDCYVASLGYEMDPEEIITSRAQLWRFMVLQGRLQEVVTEIEELALPDGVRLHLLVQLLQGTGRDEEMLDVIAKLRPYLAGLPTEAAIQVARFVQQMGDDELVEELLPETADGISNQLRLEEALELSTYLEDNKRIALFDGRLTELFPYSKRLRENRDRRLLINSGNTRSDESHLFTTAGFTDQHLTVQKRLSALEPEYGAAIEEADGWGQDWLELTVLCCAIHAQSFGKPIEAANTARFITSSELYGRQATQILLSSIKVMLLKELVPEGGHDYYRNLFQAIFRFLAQHPEDDDVRLRLLMLLSVESCGEMGIPIAALTLLDLTQQGVRLVPSSVNADEARSLEINEAIETSIRNGFMWLADIGVGEPGVTVMPRELLVANPDDVVQTLGRFVHLTSAQRGENVDLEYMRKLVLLACAICPHAGLACNEDIRLMRHLASQFAVAGQFQQARNFAEAILLMGRSSAYRRRLAWQAFGDIYHRCHNHVVALVGLACAQAVDVAVEKADLWHEAYCIHRILRDLGLFELSRALLPTMKTLLSDLGFDATEDPRYICADLGLQLMETDGSAVKLLDELLEKIAEACRKELGNRTNLFPLALLLGQVFLKAEGAGVSISQDKRALLKNALFQIGISMADLIRTVSTAKPSSKDVLAMFNSVERAMYTSDVSRDYTVLKVAARRLLDLEQQGELIPNESAFATELLADHTVALTGNVPEMTLEWPVRYATELNQAGLDVAFLALNSLGELTVIHVSDGQAKLIVQPRLEQNFRSRLRSWLQDYPKTYGCIDSSEGNNIFFTTMEELNVRLPLSDRLVLVAEPFLQQLTANLVVVQPEDGTFGYFAGMKTAIGIVPSLSWLSTVNVAKRSGLTLYKAWISAAANSASGESLEVTNEYGVYQEQPERESTLDIALRRLSGCFEEFGFVVDTGRKLPKNMKDAGLVVVTAHGGLDKEGRYLRSIRDDENLFEAPSALATALAGVELVILFVCSGGRIDKNPWDNSTISLPKQLLNNGCRAVIASPWPLNVMVTYNWLAPFLREWEAGATVLDATKKANDMVAQRLGDVPQYSLAMRVYGDVLLAKSGT